MGGARQQDFAEARMPGANGMPGANARFRQRAAVRFTYFFCGYIFLGGANARFRQRDAVRFRVSGLGSVRRRLP